MAKDIGHVFEAGALVDHLRGGGMPEHMSAQSSITTHTRPPYGASRNSTDGRRIGKRSKGRLAVEKDHATGGGGTSPAEGVGSGRTDVFRQR